MCVCIYIGTNPKGKVRIKDVYKQKKKMVRGNII